MPRWESARARGANERHYDKRALNVMMAGLRECGTYFVCVARSRVWRLCDVSSARRVVRSEAWRARAATERSEKELCLRHHGTQYIYYMYI